jgi:glycosyltransferase involved in cell wall biosynthesis
MKVAIVHDYLAQAGGAERVVEAMHDMYPSAPIFTSVYDKNSTFSSFENYDIHTSYLQFWPFCTKKYHKLALPFYPSAFERFDFRGYDLVLSSASSFAKGVMTPFETCHICYCHTPTRFLWRAKEYASQTSRPDLFNKVMEPLFRQMRTWDIESAHRVDYFIANSYNVAKRIRKFYRRSVVAVVYPPVQVQKFHLAPKSEIGSHFLVVSRLLSYKRVDIAIQACNMLNVPLRIIGTGPDEASLRKLAGPNITFLGRQSDEQVSDEMATCRALIFAGEEDFGITAVEAMASGRPVVAFASGGALETVIDGKTGVFFEHPTAESLAEALKNVQSMEFSQSELQDYANQFSSEVYQSTMKNVIEASLEDYASNNSVDGIKDKSVMLEKSFYYKLENRFNHIEDFDEEPSPRQ